MASSKTTPIFFADGAADTMSFSIQTEFRVGLGRRADEKTNNSDLSLFNFRSLCNIHLCMSLTQVSSIYLLDSVSTGSAELRAI